MLLLQKLYLDHHQDTPPAVINDTGEVLEADQKEETAADERREFCIRTLGNEKFSGEQINLIVPCLQDENIPLSTLQILCRPDLPAENMNGLIRFIRGGKTNDGKQGS